LDSSKIKLICNSI